MMPLPHTFARRLVAIAAIASLAACGKEPEASAADGPADSARADSLRADTVTAPVATADQRAWLGPVGDSTLRPRLIAGRNKRDSISMLSAMRAGQKRMGDWPVGPAPAAGAILPGKRIIAYYGNPLSKRMGVLGEYPVDDMLARLDKQVAEWKAADPSTPVQPALHLVTVVAQGAPGRDGKYRLRMADSLIERVYGWAKRKNAILFLDIQVGHSTVQEELPRLLPWLERPDVHLGLDPEFSMHYDKAGIVPGRKIGTMDAAEINYAVRTLAKLSAEKNIPPKVLVVHRFTRRMITNASAIKADPRVQVVIDMDGWGPPWLKFDSYRDYVVAEPVQFAGFKLFYHNDTKKGDALLSPKELIQLFPRPLYIQYQ